MPVPASQEDGDLFGEQGERVGGGGGRLRRMGSVCLGWRFEGFSEERLSHGAAGGWESMGGRIGEGLSLRVLEGPQ